MNAKMKRIFSLFTLSFLAFSTQAMSASFTLESNDFKSGSTLADDYVFNGFGCSGKNFSVGSLKRQLFVFF